MLLPIALSPVAQLVFKFSHFSLSQAIPPLEFMFRNDKISLTFVEANIQNPVVAKGNICRELKVFPAECRGRRCTYKGKIVVRLRRVDVFRAEF